MHCNTVFAMVFLWFTSFVIFWILWAKQFKEKVRNDGVWHIFHWKSICLQFISNYLDLIVGNSLFDRYSNGYWLTLLWSWNETKWWLHFCINSVFDLLNLIQCQLALLSELFWQAIFTALIPFNLGFCISSSKC